MRKRTDDYTITEAARLLNVSTATVWRWIDRKILPAYRIGPRKIRIKREELEIVIQPARPEGGRAGAEKPRQDIWAGYDPERVRHALKRSAGAFAGVDREALLVDIRKGRAQASAGRSE